MSQVTWRAPDDLVDQVRAAAARDGRSLNDFVTRVMTAVVDPSTADGELAGLRERLARAGVLEVPSPVASRPDPAVVAEARHELAGGLGAAEAVAEGRG